MTPDRAEWVLEVVGSALERNAADRSEFIIQACGDDFEFRAEVESLLAQQDRVIDFIEAPPSAFAAEALQLVSDETLRDKRLGPYRLVRKIGQGGMGAVYLAERDDRQYEKQVAIKIITFAFDAEEVRRRFRHERQILAALDHPNIARLLDAGTSEEGVPYFVMEYVDAIPIDQYCKSQRLDIVARLELFRTVCSAVQYAHQNLVIHRDIKPGNILVTPDGFPKLLDFGVAKLLDPDPSHPLVRTITEVRALTPEYASPEQIHGANVTTATDIYSLGVLLYELVTGQRPYRLKVHTHDEIARAITTQEPARPSAAISLQPSVINARSLRGDLDNIVLMAMRKEPSRRYASVSQFAEDIRRHLEGLPVIARKDTWRYRTNKFVLRNKLAVAAAALVFLTLVGGIVATIRQARIATVERDRARRQAAKAESVTTFLQNVLGFSDPGWASSNPNRQRDATISEALVEAGRRAETELANEPQALAAVHFTIGTTYRVQGRYPEAEPHLRAALDIRRRVLGAAHPDTAQSMVVLAEWCVLTARYPEAESLFREALPVFRATHDAKWLAIALNDYGVAKSTTGDAAAAEKLLREGLEGSAGLTGADRAPRAIMYSVLGAARRDQGDVVEAAALLEKSIQEHHALPGEPRSELAFTLMNLAGVRLLQGDYDHAESLLHEAFELFRKNHRRKSSVHRSSSNDARRSSLAARRIRERSQGN